MHGDRAAHEERLEHVSLELLHADQVLDIMLGGDHHGVDAGAREQNTGTMSPGAKPSARMPFDPAEFDVLLARAGIDAVVRHFQA